MDTVHKPGFTDFLKYRGTPFEKYVLPIIPANAQLSETSKIPPAQLGKIPGRMHDDGKWVGFADWQKHYAYFSSLELELWFGWQLRQGIYIPLAFNSIVLNGFDADTSDPEVAHWFSAKIEAHLGITPMVRRRDGSVRFMLAYRRDEHTAPYTKLRVTCVRKGEDHKTSEKHMLEILPSNCQWVGEGPHAKGAMHYWENEAPVRTL
jgi:hypothetical protein